MKEVVKFLTENPVQYLATAGLDGKPRNRPFQYMLEDGGRLYFCTANTKDVYRELQKNPHVELTVSSATFAWIRLSGKAVFSTDMTIKDKIIEVSPLVKSIYQTGSNPIFEVFYLSEAKAAIADFSGNPPQEFIL